ncbi:MAG: hypothetical protein GY842_14730 [bacterium]|nr:hypothetical protein [bacterium]
MVLGLVAWLFPGDVGVAADPSVDQGEVVVRTVDAASVEGRLRRFSLAGGLTLQPQGSAEPVSLPAADVVRIVRFAGNAPLRTGGAIGVRADRYVEVSLVGGGRLWVEPIRPEQGGQAEDTEDVVLVATPFLGSLELPLSMVERWGSLPRGVPAREGTDADAGFAEDRLLLNNGDQVHGLLLGIDAEGVRFETEGTVLRMGHAQVAAVELVADEAERVEGLQAQVHFTSGERLSSGEITCADERIELLVFGKVKRRVPLSRVRRLEVSGGRWSWVTELKPISVEHTPMLSLGWAYVRDGNVLGGPLRVAGREFAHGLGVHSESSLIFDLAGEYETFVTEYGLDDSAGPLADVTVEIRVDGAVAHRQAQVRGRQLWGPVRADVRGAARVELRVLFGENVSVQDRFDWIDTGLVRRSEPVRTN